MFITKEQITCRPAICGRFVMPQKIAFGGKARGMITTIDVHMNGAHACHVYAK
jgi:hypothetical protein